MPSSTSLKGHGCVVGEGVGVSEGMGVKKTVGRGVRVGLSGISVAVGAGVRVGGGVQVGGGVSVTASVGFGVGVLSNATSVGSGASPSGVRDGAMNSTMKNMTARTVSPRTKVVRIFHTPPSEVLDVS